MSFIASGIATINDPATLKTARLVGGLGALLLRAWLQAVEPSYTSTT
jgi:hypothetical protein